MRRNLVAVLALAALTGSTQAMAASAATGPAVGDAAPKLDVKDIRDRALAIPEPGRVMVLSFASKSTGEAAGDVTREIRVDYPDAPVLSFIDLSGFPGFLRGMIRKKILARQDGAVKDAKAAFTKAGKTPPTDVDALIHIIPDFDESSCKAYGAMDTGHTAKFVVIGADGRVAAVFEKTPKIDEVRAAVKAAFDAASSPASATTAPAAAPASK